MSNFPGDINFLRLNNYQFQTVPDTVACNHLEEEGLTPLFYTNVPYHDRETKVFAWIGLPEGASKSNKAPGIILVHGGGGTAFSHWVRMWNKRGYAAIAMDTCGSMPTPKHKLLGGCVWPRHDWSGPQGWGGFDQMDEKVENHWTYHAVNAIARGHSLLASMEEVDASRIGITGVSWGGVLTCLSASLDHRYQCAAPIYGCGFLTEESDWVSAFQRMGAHKVACWKNLYDPSSYLSEANCQMLWYNGTNDFTFFPSSWQKSAAMTRAESRLCMKLRWPHGHGAIGEEMNELPVFMDSILKKSVAYPRIKETQVNGNGICASVESDTAIIDAQLIVTFDDGFWPNREWHSLSAEWSTSTSEARAIVPPGTKAAYLQIIDERKIYLSGERKDF